MRIHHLDCVSMCPFGGKFFDGRHSVLSPARLVCHCLLIETRNGLVLVDTGFGTRDVDEPSRLSAVFRAQMRPALRYENTALAQIERLGFRVEDVRHIVLTHLDFDHAGGLDDFPQARIHLTANESRAALRQRTWLDRQRFRPAQWGSSERWSTYSPSQGEAWFGFECVRGLDGVEEPIFLVPLPGHTLGHAGVAVDQGPRWLLHAGDAYFYHNEMDLEDPRCTPGLRAYQTLMEKDRTLRLGNQERLRELKRAHGREVEIFCAHDCSEFEAACAKVTAAGTSGDEELRAAGSHGLRAPDERFARHELR